MRKKLLKLVAVPTLAALSILSVGLLQIAPASADAQVQRPFIMHTFGQVVSETPSNDCPFVKVLAEEAGTAAHMGNLTVTRSHCFSPFDDPPISSGYWEAVAANGDRIWGSYYGWLVPTEFDDQGNPVRGTITAPFTIDGGTGRFQGASGQGTTIGDFNLLTEEGDFESKGTITY